MPRRPATPKRLYSVTVDIAEAATGYAYPVVRHTFFGTTKAEAWHYHDSHKKSDGFYRGCVDKGRWKTVTCRATLVGEGWVRRP